MKRQQRNLTVHVDTYTRVCLTAIAVLLTVLILGLWVDGPAISKPARAKGFVNAAQQRETIISDLKQTNAKLDELIALMASGKAKVQVVEAKEVKGGPNVKPPEPKK